MFTESKQSKQVAQLEGTGTKTVIAISSASQQTGIHSQGHGQCCLASRLHVCARETQYSSATMLSPCGPLVTICLPCFAARRSHIASASKHTCMSASQLQHSASPRAQHCSCRMPTAEAHWNALSFPAAHSHADSAMHTGVPSGDSVPPRRARAACLLAPPAEKADS